ncbi:Rrf2 family transcriptional regulator [Patescibacteria group bacterium]|nr:Rrf2 family transcriptional regulator [Patescibacteria group bacterium]
MVTISKKVEYSIVFISFLAKNKGKNISLTEASKKLLLPYRFLGQLATSLKIGGIVEAQEGKNGGYRLVEGWEKKNLFDLLEVLGENKAMVTCLGDKSCVRAKGCNLKKMWEKVERGWYLELKKVKLSEI